MGAMPPRMSLALLQLSQCPCYCSEFKRPHPSPTTLIASLWKDYFRDPSQFLDLRNIQPQRCHQVPDFRHICSGMALWIDGIHTPPWVHAKLQSTQLIHFQGNANYNRAATIRLIKSCGKKKDITVIRRIYADKNYNALDIVIANTLIRSFARCGALLEAREVFEQLVEPDNVSWSALIAGYVDQGFGEEALACFKEMQRRRAVPDSVTYMCALKACSIVGAIGIVEEIHACVKQQALLNKEITLGSALLNAYARCGAVKKAGELFEELTDPDVVCWTVLIAAYADAGFGAEALACFRQMQNSKMTPDPVTYTSALKACSILRAVEVVEEIHALVRQQTLLDKDIVLGSTLVTAYARCGSMEKAQEVFNILTEQDVVSWTALLAGYVDQGLGQEALACFNEMQISRVRPDSVTYTCALKACAIIGIPAVHIVEKIHACVRHSTLLKNDVFLENTLVYAYARCGELKKAQELINQLVMTDVSSWNVLIVAYAESGLGEKALACFKEMQRSRVTPNSMSYIGVLKACSLLGAVETVDEIYACVRQQAVLISDIVLGTTLVNAYARCGAVGKAQEVFDRLQEREVAAWNALIAGYAEQGFGEKALACFWEMQRNTTAPDSVTYTCALKACTMVGAVKIVDEIYCQVKQLELLHTNDALGSMLVNAYAKCGVMERAQEVFKQITKPDVVSWTALIGGYAEQGFGEEALVCFRDMQSKRVMPDPVSYTCALKACSMVRSFELVEEIHACVRQNALLNTDVALGNALISAYATCGGLREAQEVFEGLADVNVISWNALIGGYVEQGMGKEALLCFKEMQSNRVKPDSVTYTSALKACAIVGDLEVVKEINLWVRQLGLLKKDIVLGNVLVYAYARCYEVKAAWEMFQQLAEPDVASWNALIAGFAEQDLSEEALVCFREMQRSRAMPDSVTYVCALKACAILGAVHIVEEIHASIRKHALMSTDIVLGNILVCTYARCGAVKEARTMFEQLAQQEVVSWTALIAGYAKMGCVNEMLDLSNRMMATGIFPSPVTFVVLLNGCSHGALLEEGIRLFSMMEVHGLPRTAEHYTCMIDLFARAGRLDLAKCFVLDDASTLLTFLTACQKWIEVDQGVWAFEKLLQLDQRCTSAYLSMSNLFAAADVRNGADEISF